MIQKLWPKIFRVSLRIAEGRRPSESETDNWKPFLGSVVSSSFGPSVLSSIYLSGNEEISRVRLLFVGGLSAA